jgi:hypothetical protein
MTGCLCTEGDRAHTAAVAAWRDVEQAEPEFAARVRRLFDAGRYKTIATLRADGSPRISGIECRFADGEPRFGSRPGTRGPDAAGRPSLAWVTAIQAVDPRFEFTDPPFRHSLTMTMTLALAAAGNRPAAVLTGPAIAARSQAWPIRRSRLADTYGMVQVSLRHHPLTASAAWCGAATCPAHCSRCSSTPQTA